MLASAAAHQLPHCTLRATTVTTCYVEVCGAILVSIISRPPGDPVKTVQYRVSQKKCTNRMLLEPWCTGATTRWLATHEPGKCFLVVSY